MILSSIQLGSLQVRRRVSFLRSHATSKARFGSRLLASYQLPPTTALSLVSEVNAIFLRVSAVFSLRQTTRSACHRHYHTRCRRRRGLHVEEPIISDEENQSAFSPRLECLLLQSAIARREMGLDIPLRLNLARKYRDGLKYASQVL